MPIIYSKVTSDPAAEPILLADAKRHLRVDADDENSLITLYIQVARETVENFTNRSLITQERTAKLDFFPNLILLPNGPVQTGVTIEYYNESNVLTTLSTSEYYEDVSSDVARLEPVNYWPSTYDRPNAVEITYNAGYGSSGTDVPSPLRHAMLLIIGHLYENRQNVIMSGSPTAVLTIPMGAEVLMNPYVLEQSVYYWWGSRSFRR